MNHSLILCGDSETALSSIKEQNARKKCWIEEGLAFFLLFSLFQWVKVWAFRKIWVSIILDEKTTWLYPPCIPSYPACIWAEFNIFFFYLFKMSFIFLRCWILYSFIKHVFGMYRYLIPCRRRERQEIWSFLVSQNR